MKVNMYKSSLIIALFFGAFLLSSCTITGEVIGSINNENSNEVLRIHRNKISEDMNVLFFDAQGVEVRFLVVEDQNGNVRTAFDACDFCGGRMGYKQIGQEVECSSCGQRFRIDKLGEANVAGGCWPSYLSHEVDGDYVLIPVDELNDNAYRFT